MNEGSPKITEMLQRSSAGDKAAMDAMIPVVYDQLRLIAERCLRSERVDHTLRPSALVHEAYLRLIDADVAWTDRVHFFSVAARIMRRILVDHARMLDRDKRGRGIEKLELKEAIAMSLQRPAIVIALDEALDRLAKIDERRKNILEMLYFGGLSLGETASALHVSESTVNRELRLAKAWLYHELAG